jgi:lysine 2,3-aminomutase
MKNNNNLKQQIVPRGTEVMLPHGGLPEMVSLHLINLIKKTGGRSGPIGTQFLAQPDKEKRYFQKKSSDPLIEDEHEVAPGLVYKYCGKLNSKGWVECHGRVLWTVTRFCASYCRFCTRGREVGLPTYVKSESNAAISKKPYLSDEEINMVFDYLEKHKEINEVLISGGDPLTVPEPYLTKIINGLVKLQKKGKIDIIRIGTRLPISSPLSVKKWHYQLLAKIKNPYLMVHINHPAELTKETISVLNKFRKTAMASVLSQSVLLKGVNDSVDTLHELFQTMTKEGIRPYYVFQNDPVYWAQHLTVPIKQAVRIWEQLRPMLSGIAATARFVIDTPFGFGKIPVPEGKAWKVDYSHFFDYKKKKHALE